MDFSFIHAADIHLDSPLRGLEQYEGAPVQQIRGAVRRAFENLVELCIHESVAFLLISGDIYDGDWKDYNTGLFFANQMARLKAHQIPVYMINGNHDAESQMTKQIRLPDNVSQLSTLHPETALLEEYHVAVHGQGYQTRAVTEDLSKNYPDPLSGYLNIGMLHTSANGREGHENYAPCNVDDLIHKGYDYWALGHIHKREILHEQPWIVFPGNIQGRHIRETGAKGCTLVRVEDSKIQYIQHISLDVLRFSLCEVNLDGLTKLDEAYEKIKVALQREFENRDGKLVALRILLVGASYLHSELVMSKDEVTNNIRVLALEIAGSDIWIERVKFNTQPTISSAEIGQDPSVQAVLSYIDELYENDELMEELVESFAEFKTKLPIDVLSGEEAFRFDKPEDLRPYLLDVDSLLSKYLAMKGEE